MSAQPMTEQNRVPKGVRTAGQFAAAARAEPAVALQPAAHEMATLGNYQVSAKALHSAREVWAAVQHEPDIHTAARAWASEQGYDAETWDTYEHADQAHGTGAVLVSEWGAAVTLSGQGRRNFSVDLDGDGDTLDTGDSRGSIATVTFIYP